MTPLGMLLLTALTAAATSADSAAAECDAAKRLSDGGGGDQCGPRLRLGTLAGAQEVTVLPPAGCRCSLSLSVLNQRYRVVAPEQTCTGSGGWLKLEKGTTADNSASFSVEYAGWYQPSARDCTCDALTCRGGGWNGAQWRYERGLRPDAWNVTLAPVVLAGCSKDAPNCRLNVSVDRQLQAGAETDDVYFPRLKIKLERVGDSSRFIRQVKKLRWSPNKHPPVQFNNLRAGNYELEVKPEAFNCQGAQDGCPRRFISVSIMPSYDQEPVKLALSDPLGKAVYIAVGVLVGLAVAVLVLCLVWKARHRDWRLSGADSALPVMEKPCPPQAVPVIVFQRGSCGEAARAGRHWLTAALREAGLWPLDAQEGKMQHWIQMYGSVADLLARPEFSNAKLLFIDDGPGRAEPSAASPRGDAFFEHALCHVRNTRLGQDYHRVYLCTLGPGPSGEFLGLTEGRVFRLAEENDLSLLVSHLRAPAPPAGAAHTVSWADTASSQLLLASSSSSEETV